MTIQVWELDDKGAVVPNMLFHRPRFGPHSRCIEYPWAASRYRGGRLVLDIGTVKAGMAWIEWLRSLPCEVTCVDFDDDEGGLLEGLRFVRADIRQLGFPDGYFDTVFAISIIEHVGLEEAQTVSSEKPELGELGDAEALAELVRVLAPGGILVTTFPFGLNFGLKRGGDARVYNERSLSRFSKVGAEIDEAEYYQLMPNDSAGGTEFGKNVWKRLDRKYATARNESPIDGILCAAWKRES